MTVWFTEAAIAAWEAEPRTTPGGQPRYSELAIATALTLRAVFRLGLRQTEGLIGSILHLPGLDLPVPDHSTLSRPGETLQVPRASTGAEPVHLLVDSTGLRLSGPGEWLTENNGTRKRRSWRKLLRRRRLSRRNVTGIWLSLLSEVAVAGRRPRAPIFARSSQRTSIDGSR